MKLTREGIRKKDDWTVAGIALPSYDVQAVAKRTEEAPVWLHFGIGNIFRAFIGGIADQLLREGSMDRGILCAEAFDYEVVDKIYRPHDNLVLSVILHADGSRDCRVLGSLAGAVKADAKEEKQWERLKEIFRNPGLSMVSFTITEKGYALKNPDGELYGFVKADLENGPDEASGAMAIVAAMLLERYRNGKAPLALVSMDNVSRNGEKLQDSVLFMAEGWIRRGFADEGFLAYLTDEKKITFPWTMIDRITPRPGEDVYRELSGKGVEDMEILVTDKKTYIAPFTNTESPSYLVIEDSFPNGRPPLEKAGVYMTSRETVNKSERMKVTACLNPIHTALCTYDIMLGYDLFADGMQDPELKKLAEILGYQEGLPVVEDPGILSPKAFLDELMSERFPNVYLGDTSARIAVDISQMTAIRFGETIKAYVRRDKSAAFLTAIPLAIAGWIRYLLAVDDEGNPFELSPDPMIPYMKEQLSGLRFGEPDSLKDQLRGVLSNESLFGSDLYEAGLGGKIETMVRSELEGAGAVRRTLRSWLSGKDPV
ncbi:MAG: mannitol dehydrogenase family protein [Parasporobacterium sp.]|nr:mannitol dehydrogenase family protein [Parasporobacterium sp.]